LYLYLYAYSVYLCKYPISPNTAFEEYYTISNQLLSEYTARVMKCKIFFSKQRSKLFLLFVGFILFYTRRFIYKLIPSFYINANLINPDFYDRWKDNRYFDYTTYADLFKHLYGYFIYFIYQLYLYLYNYVDIVSKIFWVLNLLSIFGIRYQYSNCISKILQIVWLCLLISTFYYIGSTENLIGLGDQIIRTIKSITTLDVMQPVQYLKMYIAKVYALRLLGDDVRFYTCALLIYRMTVGRFTKVDDDELTSECKKFKK